MLTKINKRIKRRQGFTLVELLLVVAILAVLAFLAVPAIATTIRNARIRTCASNEIMIEQAVWRQYAELVAMGISQPYSELTGYELTGSFVWQAETDGDWLVEADEEDYLLSSYFRPSKLPVCPFDTTADAPHYEIYLTTDSGILIDVHAVCLNTEDGGAADVLHTRPIDRPSPPEL